MQNADLKKLLNFFNNKARELIPNSSNLTKENKIENCPSLNKQVQLRAMRAWVAKKDKSKVNLIRHWNLDLNNTDNEKLATLAEWNEWLATFKDRSEKNVHENGLAVSPLEEIEVEASKAVAWRIGNCADLAALVFMLAREYSSIENKNLPIIDQKIPVEFVDYECDLHNGECDHVFLIFNRPADSNLNDPSTYLDAWISDPWMNEVYQVREVLSGQIESKYWSEIYQHAPYFQSIGRSYINAEFNQEPVHSERWQNRTNANSQKWWKTGRFLDMKPLPVREQKIGSYKELIDELLKKHQIKINKIDEFEFSDLDNNEIGLLHDAAKAGVLQAKKILEYIERDGLKADIAM